MKICYYTSVKDPDISEIDNTRFVYDNTEKTYSIAEKESYEIFQKYEKYGNIKNNMY